MNKHLHTIDDLIITKYQNYRHLQIHNFVIYKIFYICKMFYTLVYKTVCYYSIV